MNLTAPPKIAVISMYTTGIVGAGLRALENLARAHGDYAGTFAIRDGDALPHLNDFDVLLCSGGPGDPTELGQWGQPFGALIDAIRTHNAAQADRPKRAFLICHSFQVMSHIWAIGEISRRDTALWGVQPQLPDRLPHSITPVFPTENFYALESRFYQVMPTFDMAQKLPELDLVITARDAAGALTAWQTTDGHIAATQFHPEGQAASVQNQLDNPPVGDDYCVNSCTAQMRDDTRERLHLLPRMEQMLVDFITKAV